MANSYNRYLAIASRVVRRSLKDDKRLAAERRGDMDLRFSKWEVCFASPWHLCLGMEVLGAHADDNTSRQGGKQGEPKNLAQANAAASADAATGSS